jgi:TDG/mug DNA glycosylase family protein
MDEAGIGFTDMCPRPTVRADELTTAEVREGATRLHGEILAHQPHIACIWGKGIYLRIGQYALVLRAGSLSKRPCGEQPERIGETRIWVIPSSSGLASKWHRERMEWMVRLAAEVSRQAGR